MDFDDLQASVADTMVWKPNGFMLETYATPKTIVAESIDIMEWMVPEKNIPPPPAYKYCSPIDVRPGCTYVRPGCTNVHPHFRLNF